LVEAVVARMAKKHTLAVGDHCTALSPVTNGVGANLVILT
jgi:hypothetical protein